MSVMPVPAAAVSGVVSVVIAAEVTQSEPLLAAVGLGVAATVFVGWVRSDRLPNGGGI